MKSNLERAKAHLERAYKGVSSLKVSGDVVDTVYEIREALRQAYRMVSEGEREESPRHASGAALPPVRPQSGHRAGASEAGLTPLTRGALEEEQEVSGDAAAEDEV